MGMKNILLISMIAICVLFAGCGPYQYNTGKEIPVSVEDEDDVDDFKSEFEKLQALLDEEEADEEEAEEDEEELVEVVEEEEEVVVEIVEEEEAVEEEAEEEVVEEVAEEEIVEEEVVVEAVEEEAEEEVVEEVAEEETVEEEEETVPEGVPTIKVKEGELVNLAITSEDEDDDTITYTFTEPLDEDGKWQTDYGDAGTYEVTITASDGELSTSQDVYIVVEEVSRAPTIDDFDDMTVDEGDTISLSPTVTDPEGGSVTLEYSGWMTSSTKTTDYDDAGTYEVTLKATSSESEESTTATITITVEDKNRAPKILSITNK